MDKIELMRVFSVVARNGSFTKAANELNIAVQTVSKYVKALEDDLGVLLFNRTTRKVTLNDTGTAYLEKCVDLLDQIDELESAIKVTHSAPKGRIRISAPTSFGELHLVPAIRDFLVLYPDISVDIDLSNRRVSLVEEGVDMALRIGELPDSTMIARKLSAMRIVVCAAPEYLQHFGKPAHPEQLTNHNCFVDHNLRQGRSWRFLENKQVFKVDVKGNFEANSPGSMRRMVLSGLGIGLCPMYVIKDDIRCNTIVPLLEQYEAYQYGVYALYPHRKHLSHRVRVLVDFLAERFRQEDWLPPV